MSMQQSISTFPRKFNGGAEAMEIENDDRRKMATSKLASYKVERDKM